LIFGGRSDQKKLATNMHVSFNCPEATVGSDGEEGSIAVKVTASIEEGKKTA
jgi:hypothetical protein